MQQPRPRLRAGTWIALLGVVAAGCGDDKAGTTAESDLVRRGRTIYSSNCIACHAPDPTQPGALGPEIAGSSRELVRARVMSAKYPEGYQPKRPTTLMIPLPYLEPELEALHAFLNR